MRASIILDVGLAYKKEEFTKLFEESKYRILYIGEKQFINDLENSIDSDNVEYFSYESLYAYENNDFNSNFSHDLTDIINFVVNNKLTTEIFDRTMSSYFFNYSTKNDVWIIRATISAYKFVLHYKPSFMLLYECSHNIRSWVIAQVCEYCGIPVRYCRNHVFTWRNVLLEGMKRNPKLLGDDTVNDHYSDWEYNMYKEISERYNRGTDAIKPEYLEVMATKKMKKLYSLKQDIAFDWKRPAHVYYKYKCYKIYESLCRADIPEKYIAFYLHLQPERSTLPEGYGFTQQYKAIALLNEIIPNDWRIIVKEHPATFYRYCTPSGRWPGFYKALADLKKVLLVPLETDTYQLMCNSKAVATIAGTVGREAMMMGKPCITFGINPYFNMKPVGMYTYESYDTLSKFIQEMHLLTAKEIKCSFDEYVKTEMLETGTLGLTVGEKWYNQDKLIYDCNRISRLKLMKYILSV